MPGQHLHVMADLVGNDVGLREIARRAEPRIEVAEERQVQIHLPVVRAVERPHRRLADAAARLCGVGEQHQSRLLVVGAVVPGRPGSRRLPCPSARPTRTSPAGRSRCCRCRRFRWIRTDGGAELMMSIGLVPVSAEISSSRTRPPMPPPTGSAMPIPASIFNVSAALRVPAISCRISRRPKGQGHVVPPSAGPPITNALPSADSNGSVMMRMRWICN